jgi:hypothetical protein
VTFFWQYFGLTLATLWGFVPSLFNGDWWFWIFYPAIWILMAKVTRDTWRTIDRIAELEASIQQTKRETAGHRREIYLMTAKPENN